MIFSKKYSIPELIMKFSHRLNQKNECKILQKKQNNITNRVYNNHRIMYNYKQIKM